MWHHCLHFPLSQAVKTRQTLPQQTGKTASTVSPVFICPCGWDTQTRSWRLARLAYCLALFAFGALGALQERGI
jgi:hypothetical protein